MVVSIDKSTQCLSYSGAPAIAGAALSYRFECMDQAGALLVLMDYATKSSVGLDFPFEEYMLRNHQSWCDFAVNLGIRRDPHTIILVRGNVKTSSWAVAAFFDAGHHGHEVTFNGQFGELASAGLKYSQQQGTVCSFEQRTSLYTMPLNQENPSRLADGGKHNQCIFLNYFKVKYRKFLPRRIVANADMLDSSGDNGSDQDGAAPSGSGARGIEIEPDVGHNAVGCLLIISIYSSLTCGPNPSLLAIWSD